MTLDETLGAVVLGCSQMALAQGWAMTRVPGVRLVGFQSASEERARELATRFGGEAFVEPERAIDRPDVDVVLVTGANHLHAPLTIAALEAGKHVLVQKPMALNLEECDAMIAASERSGKKLMVAFFEFFHPAFVRAKQLIDEGAIGRVFLMKAIMAWDTPAAKASLPESSWGFDPKRSGGGVMFHVAAHHLALLRWIVKEPVVSVYTEKDALVTGLSVEDTAITIVRTPHAMAEITNCGQIKEPCAQMGRMFKESIEIFGTEGTIHIKPEERPSLRVFTAKGQLPEKLNGWVAPVLDFVPPEDRGRSLHFNGEEDPWVGLHRHFVDRIRDGGPVITDGAFGRQVMEVILAGYESSRQGRAIKMNIDPSPLARI